MKEDVRDILGVPLKCYMLAVVREKYAEQLCTAGRSEDIELGYVVKALSTCELCDKFVKYAIKLVEKTLSYTVNREEVLSFHTYKALALLFPKIASIYLNAYPVNMASLSSVITRVGLLELTSNGDLEFVHRTIAEFLVAKLFVGLWTGGNFQNETFLELGGTYFVQEVLSTTVDYLDCSHLLIKCINTVESGRIEEYFGFFNFVLSSIVGFMNGLCMKFHSTDKEWRSVEHFKNC